MPTPTISEILAAADKQPTKADKVNYLRNHANYQTREVLRYAYDPAIKFRLPSGPMKYTENDMIDCGSVLYNEVKRLYIFTEGGNPNLSDEACAKIFNEVLEYADKDDAKLLVSMKDKKLPYASLTKALVKEAFPEMFPKKEKKK